MLPIVLDLHKPELIVWTDGKQINCLDAFLYSGKVLAIEYPFIIFADFSVCRKTKLQAIYLNFLHGSIPIIQVAVGLGKFFFECCDAANIVN